ncbi:MAG: hypothetical protein ACRD3G_12220 [Vicinamibacterales bacterium]
MSYQQERDEFIARVSAEGLPLTTARQLLALATTINRLAELACSSEAADRDRIHCPADPLRRGRPRGPCLCDTTDDEHMLIPRIRLQDHRAEQRAIALVPAGWRVITEGDPRGYTLRVIPPSYAARNAGRDRHNLDAIGVPARESGIRW